MCVQSCAESRPAYKLGNVGDCLGEPDAVLPEDCGVDVLQGPRGQLVAQLLPLVETHGPVHGEDPIPYLVVYDLVVALSLPAWR